MNEKLKPCPFCGHSAHVERYGDRGKSTIYQCDFCGCSLETGEEWGHGRHWNERTPNPAVNGGAVKPLDWTEVFGNGYEIDWRGKGVFGTYAARAVRAYDMVLANGRYYATIDQAKSSIQLDYERRILSALTSPQGEETLAAPSQQAEPSNETRQTFTVPDGHYAVRDEDGRATGEVRPLPSPQPRETPTLKAPDRDGGGE